MGHTSVTEEQSCIIVYPAPNIENTSKNNREFDYITKYKINLKGGKGMKKGIVKSWICDRGYGFIKTKNENETVFVHRADLRGAAYLREGEKVEFQVEKTKRGPKAVCVKPIFSSVF